MSYIIMLFSFLMINCSFYAMEPMEDNVQNMMVRLHNETTSSEESQFEEQLGQLISIFEDVTKIEDEQYIALTLEVLARDRRETYEQVSPYLCNRLRASYNEIRELTEARKRSSLKKLMKQLIADSINDAFIKAHAKHEEQEAVHESNARKSRMILVGVIATGVASTLAAFFAAYFGHSC